MPPRIDTKAVKAAIGTFADRKQMLAQPAAKCIAEVRANAAKREDGTEGTPA